MYNKFMTIFIGCETKAHLLFLVRVTNLRVSLERLVFYMSTKVSVKQLTPG